MAGFRMKSTLKNFSFAVVVISVFQRELVAAMTEEVKLESQDVQVLETNSTLNDSISYRFQCVVKGLSEDELVKLTSEDELENNVIINVYGAETNDSSQEDSIEENHPYNVNLNVVNGTLVVTGEIAKKSKESENETAVAIRRCDVIFHEDKSRANFGSSFPDNPSGAPPTIESDYDHVVLMNGAPDQVLSCTAEGHPPPELRWIKVGGEATPTEVLSKDGNAPGSRTSYLLFTRVTSDTSGNFSCVAQNEHGRVAKTFEVNVISVEALNFDCNEVASSSSSRKTIYNLKIHEILKRSKRHLWYQWRGQRYDHPRHNYNRPHHHQLQEPFDPVYLEEMERNRYSSNSREGSDNNDNLQKMVNFITERLLLADKVAVYKWDENLPVEDPPREEIILENMVRQAEDRGLSPSWAQRFFRDQIEANKDIQYDLIRIWRINGRRPPGPPVDLRDQVRPEIDYINMQLIELAKLTEYQRHHFKCNSEVEKRSRYAAFLYSLDPLHQTALQRAVGQLCLCDDNSRNPRRRFHQSHPPDYYIPF